MRKNVSLIKQRQGRLLKYRLVQGLNGKLRYEPILETPNFKKLTIAQTLNTVVTCRVCRGKGKIMNEDSIGYLTETLCHNCGGSKKMISV